MHNGIDVAVLLHEVFGRDMLAARKALRRFRRLAVRVECDLDGRAAVLRRDIGLLLGKAVHEERRAARRAERADGLEGDAVFLECLLGILLELGECARHYVGRNFFRADFK